MPTIKFTCCDALDFSDSYPAQKHLIASGGATKVTWDRSGPFRQPMLVQFCKKRGRLNSAEACLDKAHAACNDYNDALVSVPRTNIYY